MALGGNHTGEFLSLAKTLLSQSQLLHPRDPHYSLLQTHKCPQADMSEGDRPGERTAWAWRRMLSVVHIPEAACLWKLAPARQDSSQGAGAEGRPELTRASLPLGRRLGPGRRSGLPTLTRSGPPRAGARKGAVEGSQQLAGSPCRPEY